MNKYIKPLSILVLLALTGCDEITTKDGDVVLCTEQYVYGLAIKVFDRETGYDNACDVTVLIEDGSYREELTYGTNISCNESYIFSGAGERAGTYTVTITKPGYQEWVKTNILVTENVCHVNPVTVDAYLEK